ncbi:MAG: 6,7-dimethyl-8-ribityllumazine synthase [Rickettsiaceae bacterium]|jgi:6,7-dimethyl-8-ribityllumazine synthase|nr:6,7-dimethyl-8-ribityllumazine synthase [Rickettsiaceae bacterium]
MKKILIIEARFYNHLADMLVEGALTEIEAAGYEYERIIVPGAFEIPATISMAIASGRYVGFVGLGCVIRGETTHYDYVCEQSAYGINKLAMKYNVAIGFGIVTAENEAQALARADKTKKNMGGKAALACIRMMQIKEEMGA